MLSRQHPVFYRRLGSNRVQSRRSPARLPHLVPAASRPSARPAPNSPPLGVDKLHRLAPVASSSHRQLPGVFAAELRRTKVSRGQVYQSPRPYRAFQLHARHSPASSTLPRTQPRINRGAGRQHPRYLSLDDALDRFWVFHLLAQRDPVPLCAAAAEYRSPRRGKVPRTWAASFRLSRAVRVSCSSRATRMASS